MPENDKTFSIGLLHEKRTYAWSKKRTAKVKKKNKSG